MVEFNKFFIIMNMIQRLMERIFDHAVLISAAVLLVVYILQLNGVLSWWGYASYLIWRGGW